MKALLSLFKDIKKFQFCFLNEKLWLKEDDYKILLLNQIH